MKPILNFFFFLIFLYPTTSISEWYHQESKCKVSHLNAPLSFIDNIQFHGLSISNNSPRFGDSNTFTELDESDYKEIDNNIESLIKKKLSEADIRVSKENSPYSIYINYNFIPMISTDFKGNVHYPIRIYGKIEIREKSIGTVSKHYRSMTIWSTPILTLIVEGLRIKYKYLTLEELEKKVILDTIEEELVDFIEDLEESRKLCNGE